MMPPWFSKMTPRLTYWLTTLIPRSPVMQLSLAFSMISLDAFDSVPAKLTAGIAIIPARTQNLAMLWLVIEWFFLLVGNGLRCRQCGGGGVCKPPAQRAMIFHFFGDLG